MARITDALLESKAFGASTNQPMVDFTYGGQHGWAPDLTQWVSNAAYVRRNLVCILLEAPRFFQVMPDPDKWVQSLKSLFELHAYSIEGFNAGLKVETDEHAVGGANEMQQEFTNVTRERSNPVFQFVEKYGMPIQTFLSNWITYGLMDPDTKFAMAGTLAGDRPTDMLPDWYTASALFFEPDPLHRTVMKSWVTTNMFPTEVNDITGKRDLKTASEVLTLTVPFTGMSQFSLGTNYWAQQILDDINLNNSNPYLRPSFIQDIAADVLAATTEGYKKNVETLGAQAVSPSIR